MPKSLFAFRPAERRPGPMRRLLLRLERARIDRTAATLGGLVDVPHDVADVARARLRRLDRRARTLDRLMT
jgi:hypothetical protein